MSTDRQLISARLTGVAWGRARWHEPDEAETAAAVAELREILAGLGDGPALLAEVAGLALGFHEGGLSEPQARAAAHFCREAGADPELIRQWTGTGREWARAAGRTPFGAPRRIRPGSTRPAGAAKGRTRRARAFRGVLRAPTGPLTCGIAGPSVPVTVSARQAPRTCTTEHAQVIPRRHGQTATAAAPARPA